MAEPIDNIFSAIIKSEIIAEIEKKKHKEVKDGIEQFRSKLKKQESLKADHHTKRKQLELALADTNIGMKLSKMREESLTNELAMVTANAKSEKDKYDELSRKMTDLCTEFIKSVTKFSGDYGLSSSGIERRIHSAKEYLRSLETEKDKLKMDVKAAEDFNNDLKMILDDKSKKVDELKVVTEQINDVDKDIYTEMTSTKELETKISQQITEPDHGIDFLKVKVKEEHQKYEVTEIQSEINHLQAELQSLSSKLHKKEAYALRLQYIQWQRQQKQKSLNNNKVSLNLEQNSTFTCVKETLSQSSDTGEHVEFGAMPDEIKKEGSQEAE